MQGASGSIGPAGEPGVQGAIGQTGFTGAVGEQLGIRLSYFSSYIEGQQSAKPGYRSTSGRCSVLHYGSPGFLPYAIIKRTL